MAITQIILATTLVALSAAPALSDPYPSRLSQREKRRHGFRDVQRASIPQLRLCRDMAVMYSATDIHSPVPTGRRPTLDP